ncbi:PREDICTED: uncharacterized protein LOC109339067, partial [Lupinus angustifolius]|uniref:uncharacterized protein LOC109339067 n=1 Tax=Lupinus angustifolius TaxID=3871 RepID=UPI00092ED9E9
MPQESDPNFDAWERCNTMVFSWITRSVTQQIAQSTTYMDSSQELWDDLKKRFSKGDHFRTSDILQEIHSMKQGDRSVSTFHTDLKTLWDELDSLRPIPSCVCTTQCICSSITLKTIRRHRDAEYVICFLKGLGDQYHSVRAQILLMDPLPSINKVFSMILQQEGNLCGENPKSTVNNFNSNTSWRPQGNRTSGRGYSNRNPPRKFDNISTTRKDFTQTGNNNKVCTFCNKEGHTTETCYFKHGFPPNFKFRSRTQNKDGTINSIITNEDDPSKKGKVETQEQREDSLQLNISHEHTINQMSHDSDAEGHILSGTHPNNQTWILDSGASDHVTNFLAHFTLYTAIRPITIKLPNNMSIIARQKGTIKLTQELTLYNV